MVIDHEPFELVGVAHLDGVAGLSFGVLCRIGTRETVCGRCRRVKFVMSRDKFGDGQLSFLFQPESAVGRGAHVALARAAPKSLTTRLQ